MGTMVDRILKILCKFQMNQSQGQERRRSRKRLVQFTWAKFSNLWSKTPTFKMGLKEEESALMHVIQATDGGA
jgi:hypothetical protein